MKNLKKGKVMSSYLAAAFSVASMTMPVFADTASGDAINSITLLIDVVVTIVRLVGIGFAVFGIYQFSTSLNAHDPSQRAASIMSIAGGILMIFAKELLGMIGVSW